MLGLNAAQFITGRDEFGLPIFGKNREDLAVTQVGREEGKPVLKSILKKSKGEPSGAKDLLGKEVEETISAKTWSSVLKSPPPVAAAVTFDYVPLEKGEKVVTPLDEVLKKGMDKFKCCIVGKFTKATLSFHLVKEIAFSVWRKKGLALVSQKDDTTFVFRFNSVRDKNDVLAKGTWYFNNRPFVVSSWGCKVGSEQVSSMPIWVKFSNVPDCYWTRKGLSRIASVLGVPLGADALTSQLEILPFAKMCVQYTVGDPLPNCIPMIDMDPATETKMEADVQVTSLNKTLFCSACNSLGHRVNVCPIAKRVWVQKSVTKGSPSTVTSQTGTDYSYG